MRGRCNHNQSQNHRDFSATRIPKAIAIPFNSISQTQSRRESTARLPNTFSFSEGLCIPSTTILFLISCSDREGDCKRRYAIVPTATSKSDGPAPKRSEAERKQAMGLSQAMNLASCVQVPPDRAWPLVSKFHSGRRLFSQAFPNYAHFHTYFVTRECGIMLRIIYVQILHIMTTACSAMEEFEILKSRKFSYLDRDIAFLLGHNSTQLTT